MSSEVGPTRTRREEASRAGPAALVARAELSGALPADRARPLFDARAPPPPSKSNAAAGLGAAVPRAVHLSLPSGARWRADTVSPGGGAGRHAALLSAMPEQAQSPAVPLFRRRGGMGRRSRAAFSAPCALHADSGRRPPPTCCRCAPARAPGMALDVSGSARIVILPGMDGTASLLIDQFARSLCSGRGACDPSRVVLVDYPRERHLSCAQLGAHVVKTYLDEMEGDDRGYVLVAQSFSGHVALRLAGADGPALPGVYRGTCLVNTFCSAPVPGWARSALHAIPKNVFAQQPPAWVATRLFFGRRGTVGQMNKVREAVSPVLPEVMKARLSSIADEDTWPEWRDSAALPGSSLLYLRGAGDALVGATRHVSLLRQARSDVRFVSIEEGPHLVLQTHGALCARLVSDFAAERVAAMRRARVEG
jgi:Alpha/beta hydrolase family